MADDLIHFNQFRIKLELKLDPKQAGPGDIMSHDGDLEGLTRLNHRRPYQADAIGGQSLEGKSAGVGVCGMEPVMGRHPDQGLSAGEKLAGGKGKPGFGKLERNRQPTQPSVRTIEKIIPQRISIRVNSFPGKCLLPIEGFMADGKGYLNFGRVVTGFNGYNLLFISTDGYFTDISRVDLRQRNQEGAGLGRKPGFQVGKAYCKTLLGQRRLVTGLNPDTIVVVRGRVSDRRGKAGRLGQ